MQGRGGKRGTDQAGQHRRQSHRPGGRAFFSGAVGHEWEKPNRFDQLVQSLACVFARRLLWDIGIRYPTGVIEETGIAIIAGGSEDEPSASKVGAEMMARKRGIRRRPLR